MALRIDLALTHGEIDNTERGRVRAKLWLLGRVDPVELDLEGDAWRDVAGTKVSFTNRAAHPQEVAGLLEPLQTGVVGDITVSRKVRVFSVPEDEWKQAYLERRIEDVPTEWCNSLYLEWFSTQQGRCVVESADFDISISDHEWQLDEDEEAAQKMANMQAMRDFLAVIIQRPEEDEGNTRPVAEPEDFADDSALALSEEEWEAQLQASDRLSDASMEAYEKYGEDEDAEEKTAFVMGWDHLLGDMADALEGVEPHEDDTPGEQRRREWTDFVNQAAEEEEIEEEAWKSMPDELEEEEDEEDGESAPSSLSGAAAGDWPSTFQAHPLSEQSRRFLVEVMRELRTVGLGNVAGEEAGPALDRFLSLIMQMSGKLAGALNGRRDVEDPMHRGYVLAITKRCLNWANEAQTSLAEVRAASKRNSTYFPLLESWTASLQSLKLGVTRLREDLGGE